MKKRLYALTLFILMASLFTPFFVLADGMMIRPDPYSDRWDYSSEANQQAIINYENGLEKMIISVGLYKSNSQGVVWLLPVPSEPNKVVIDIVKELPQLRGEEISGKAKSYLSGITSYLMLTQIYSFYFFQLTSSFLAPSDSLTKGGVNSLGGGSSGGETDVVVYEHLEKEGITSEIITAKTAEGLYGYLKNKGLKIESGTIPVLDQYIGKDYSFVASWISPKTIPLDKIISPEEFKKNLTVYIDPGYYPRLYKKLQDKYFNEYNKPLFNWNAISYLESKDGEVALEWLVQSINEDPTLLWSAQRNEEMNNTSTLKQKGIFVTFPTKEIYYPLLPTSVYESKIIPATIKIIGHVSPKLFSDIKNYTKIGYYTGWFSPEDSSNTDTVNLYKNFCQKFSSQINSYYIKYTKIEINAPSKVLTDDLWISSQAPLKTYYTSFVANQLLIIGIILLFVTSFITGILVGLIVFKEARSKKGIIKCGLLGLFNCFSVLGLIIATVFARTKEMKEEDKALFDQLKAKGYSTRSLQYRDSRKFLFIIFFSISYLIITWGIIELIKITV